MLIYQKEKCTALESSDYDNRTGMRVTERLNTSPLQTHSEYGKDQMKININ